MSETTNIAWTDSTAGPWLICTEVSPGCGHCYAREMMMTRLKTIARNSFKAAGFKDWETRPVWGDTAPRILTRDFRGKMLAMNRKPFICDGCGEGHQFAAVSCPVYPGQPAKVHCPNCDQPHTVHRRRSFPSLIDWLDDMPAGIIDQDGNKLDPIAVLADFLDTLRQCDQMVRILCTKRPENFFTKLQRALEFVFHREGATDLFLWIEGWKTGENIPKNIILLTSVENQEQDWRIDELRKIPAACRGSSFEPLLSPIGFGGDGKLMDGISWAIIGCESGPRRRECKLEWIESLVEQGKSAGVAVFVKQVSINGKVSHDPAEWPEHLRVREWPKGL